MDIKTFLNPTKPTVEEKEIVIGDRYVDDKGNPVKFKIKSLTVDKLQEIQQNNTQIKGKGTNKQPVVNQRKSNDDLLIESLVEPNLKSKDLQDAFNVMGADKLIPLMFNSGEYFTLLNEITKINHLNDDETFEDDVKTAKN